MARQAAKKPAPATKKSSADARKAKPKFSKEEIEKFYYDMLLIRRFEEKAGQIYGIGLIGGFCHLYIGQEAVVVGMKSALTDDDAVITSYRLRHGPERRHGRADRA